MRRAPWSVRAQSVVICRLQPVLCCARPTSWHPVAPSVNACLFPYTHKEQVTCKSPFQVSHTTSHCDCLLFGPCCVAALFQTPSPPGTLYTHRASQGQVLYSAQPHSQHHIVAACSLAPVVLPPYSDPPPPHTPNSSHTHTQSKPRANTRPS